mmetsp:Transcript_28423/g.46252  ORF Transcript_28423/g.46252 Transcript_28423/m.46252 type:complete len:110 (-) Transcript_28423:442-771(-)
MGMVMMVGIHMMARPRSISIPHFHPKVMPTNGHYISSTKKNPWGLDVEEMLEQDTKCKFDHGLHYLQVTPDDSSTYTVGVVPAAAFKHLDNVGNSDDELSEEGSSPGIW